MTAAPMPPSDATPLLARRRVLGPAYRLFYDEPLRPVRAEGVWIEDLDGRRFLDAYNNVPVVGHAHPRIVDALTRQASAINTHTRYLQEGVVAYGEMLVAHFPPPLDTVMFTCSGSEANDLALRIARAATGRSGLIVTANAYHGVTAALADASPSLQPVGKHVRTVPAPDGFREGAVELPARFAADIRAAAEDLRSCGLAPAALIVDTTFASDGIHIAPPGVLAAGAAAIRLAGGLFIADEVQGGFCRTGTHWWAFEHDTVVPDIVTLGKPMGNGHPIGGVVLTAALAAAFSQRGRYFNTFGGNSVSAAVGTAVLETLRETDAAAHAEAVGAYLGRCLAQLAQQHRCVGDVRGRGLYRGVEMAAADPAVRPDGAAAARVVNGLRRAGVLVGTCGAAGHVIKIRPPLCFGRGHVDQLVEALDLELTFAAGHPAGRSPLSFQPTRTLP